MTLTDITAIAALVIGAYGAGLSTYTQFADKRRRLKVSFGAGMIADGIGQLTLIVSASNHGRVPVTLKETGIELPDERHVIAPNQRGTVTLPCDIGPGQGESFFVNPRALAQTLHHEGASGAIQIRA